VLLLGDRDSLARALFNVAGNAIRYTHQGEVTLSLTTNPQGERIIAVADTGIGIAPEHLPHVFERFYRGTTSRTDGGSGLGLSLAQEIVKRHHGRLEVDSEQGKGSTFSMIFPPASIL